MLIALFDRPDGLSVLLTRRTDHLRHHPGQISFPGGGIEAIDESPVHAALREAEEEIGLPPAQVEVLGTLPSFSTGTGFHITPVVAVVTPPVVLTPDPFEVAEIIEVPLSFVLDPANRQQREVVVDGVSRLFWTMPWHDVFIWGATAGMLVMLAHKLEHAAGATQAPP